MQTQNASLIYRESEELKHVILLPGEKVKFGRDHVNDIRLALYPIQELVFQLATTDISRQHFVVSRKNENYTIRDMDSTNGTSVDCIAVIDKETPLTNGQIVDVGGVLDLRVDVRDKALSLRRVTNTPQESYLLFSDSITLGCSPDDVLTIKGANVSPQHGRIGYHGSTYSISRFNDSATILVNSIPLSPGEQHVLKSETHIAIGEVDILFKLHKIQ